MQWAELKTSGKTGMLASKKIAKELDELSGRENTKIINPSAESSKIKDNYQNDLNKRGYIRSLPKDPWGNEYQYNIYGYYLYPELILN